jgi:RND family efflux transporter MFP subunit
MSDRVIVTLATVPMISGALLLLAFQRAPALDAAAPGAGQTAALSAIHQGTAKRAPWVGVIVAGNTAELAADQAGKVTDVWLEAGARVEADQQILQIDSSEATGALGMAGAELGQRSSEAARAQARYEDASSKLTRLKAGGKWIADHEIERAQAEVRMAEAELRAAHSAVQMGRAKVSMQKSRAARYRLRAPFAGRLVSCDVDPGDSVNAGQVLARVISDDRHVRFALPPDQALGEGEIKVLVRDTLSGRALITQIKTLKPEIDSSAQLVFATATLKLDERQAAAWLPGTRVEVSPAENAIEVLGDERFSAAEESLANPAALGPR